MGVEVKLWDPLRTSAIPEHFWGVVSGRGAISSVRTFTLTFTPVSAIVNAIMLLFRKCAHRVISVSNSMLLCAFVISKNTGRGCTRGLWAAQWWRMQCCSRLEQLFTFKFPVSLSSLLHAARVFSSTTHARVEIVIYVIMSSYTKYDDQS